jgi:TonB family protein
MSWKSRIVGCGLMLALVGGLGMPVRTHAQEATDLGKRKAKLKVAPEYPDLARHMNVTGKVRIEAVISADGKVTSTKVLGGSPLLVSAAVDALKKWKFEPAPKETTETLEFDFQNSGN